MRKNISGFTLVELLIVIVVIAILATITIVAYNGIQQKANNTTTIQGTEAYIKALSYYALDHNGDYPNATGCFGTIGAGYTPDHCLSQSGTAACFNAGTASATALTTSLLPYMNNTIPTISTQAVSCGGTTYIGAYGSYNTTTGIVSVYMTLDGGGQSCPSLSPNVISSSAAHDGDATMCRYYISN